jgi:hypothetical protein
MKKELELRQNQDISKLQVINEKAKKSGHAAGFTNRGNQSFINTSRSKISQAIMKY